MTTREIRRKALMTQDEFAKELGLDKSTVHKWEMKSGEKRIPSLANQRKIKEFCEKRGIDFGLYEKYLNGEDN